LEWLDGVTGDKTFSVPITDDILSEGDERFFVTLSSPTGGALLDAPSTAAVTIAKNDPRVSGSTFSEDGTALGDQVTLKLVGGGTLEYFLTNDKGPITAINLNNTISTKSVLALTVRKPLGGTGNGRTTIGEINGGGVKLLSLAAADLVGNGIHLTDFLGSLLIGAVQNGADISLHAVKRLSGRGTAITAGVIGDGTNIELINAPLNALTAISVGAGSITAPSIGSIVIKGKGIPGTIGSIPGNFKSDIFVEGIDLPLLTPALKLLRVFGTVSDSTIQIGGAPGTIGNVGTILVGAFVNSRLFAGYTGQIDGLGTFLPSTVAVFRITGLGENSVFDNSYVIAANFNSVLVDVVEPDNDDVKFGFLYHTKMKSLKVKSPIFIFNPLGADQQEIINSDFYVKKV
jgi:hypothetical protein